MTPLSAPGLDAREYARNANTPLRTHNANGATALAGGAGRIAPIGNANGAALRILL